MIGSIFCVSAHSVLHQLCNFRSANPQQIYKFFYIQCFYLYCASYQFMSAFAVQIVLCLLGLIDSNLNKLINFSKYVIVVEKRQEEKGKEG